MALKIGDKIPSFTSIDSKGDSFEIKDYLGKPLVIYFYPKDDTPGCTIQACTFRDKYEDFKSLGAEVIGISSDSLSSHQKFASRYKLPFILLSDFDKKIRTQFGVPNDFLGLIPGRATYVIDKNGLVQLIFDSTSAKIHIEKALEILKRM
ncbi:peroxiredoxin [Flavobacterium paronense]|uniref:thioredoxin-dependent peroxiredoxin n=1 Tax=Flavobacterium paronense TaxID=1392775 RepID=A0ABV5GAZ0_9FLAO|nr:peroxiredoxin [Flavobacterium paronense]MDN3675804.1 peroxiredoxin [Flavobacterium paronense]MDN3675821.1 peroxiredoxin [Flavobacterium paronense]MDN3676762.1 peroxiredoxin [Flavobacterium paronense]